MREKLFSLLGIESGEESMVSMLLTQSVFLGVFFGAFDISAHSLFLSIFDEKMMARGYVISGVAGIILTSLYTLLQTRMHFKVFSSLNLIIVTLLTVVLWAALIFVPAVWVVFLVFVMLGPLNILAMLGFWGTTSRLFTLRQGKRLFGIVDAGLVVGIILSCYTIPVLLAFNFESHNILLVSAASVLIASVIQIIIGSRFKFSTAQDKSQTEKKAKNNRKSFFSVLRGDSYIRIIGIFITLSVITAFFVQYSFMAVTRAQYPAEEDMARFLGIFTGSMMIFTLLVKLLVFSYLIKNYGLRICLAISPILIAVFTAMAIGIGMLMGYTPESASGFLIFFLLLALGRLFSKSLKDSIESPSFKVIYQTIDEKIRYEVQSGMDGTVNEIAALASGLILAGLGILSFIKLIHFSVVLFIFIVLWVIVALKLYTEYRKSIRKALEAVDKEDLVHDKDIVKDKLKNRFSCRRAFKADYFKLISGDLSPVEKKSSKGYIEEILSYSASTLDFNLLPVLEKITVLKGIDEDSLSKAKQLVKKIKEVFSGEVRKEDKLLYAAKLMAGTRLPQTAEILRLLRDNSIEVKRQAILMIGKFKISDMLTEVCECLSVPGLESDASIILESFGKDAEEELLRYFLASSGNITTSRTVLRLLGKIHTKETEEFMFSRLWSNSRQLKELALRCLIDFDYTASGENKDRLHQLISDTVGLMTWNLTARISLEKNNDTLILKELDNEINRWSQFLFNILSVTYDSSSVIKIKENLENETVESVNFALEMIDIVIDESIKPKLIALLDMVSDEEKVKNLYQFFPGDIPQYDNLLENILNRDYNILSIWIKASVLRNLKKIKGDEMKDTAIALLFSSEKILQEETARLLARTGKELYDSVSPRIPEQVRDRMDNIINDKTDIKELSFEKILFLSGCFSGIPEEELLFLAEEMRYVDDLKKDFDISSDDYLIWPLSDGRRGSEVYLCYAEWHASAEEEPQFMSQKQFYIIPLKAVEKYSFNYPENSRKLLDYIDKNEV